MDYKHDYLVQCSDNPKILTIRTAMTKLDVYERQLNKPCFEFTSEEFIRFFSENKWVYSRTFSMYRSVIANYMKYLASVGISCDPALLLNIKLKQLDNSVRYEDMFSSFYEMDKQISSVFFTGDYDAKREGTAAILYAVGLSKEEIALLTFDHIDFDKRKITIWEREFNDVEQFVLDYLKPGEECRSNYVIQPSGHRNLFKGRGKNFSKRLLSLAKKRWYDNGYQNDRIIPTNMRNSYTFIKLWDYEERTRLSIRSNMSESKDLIFYWTGQIVSSDDTMRSTLNDYAAWKIIKNKW